MIITIVNHKGGVGKTCTAVNLATALGNQKKRVLVIDNDPQGNATKVLTLKKNQNGNTVHELLAGIKKDEIENIISPTKSRNVWLIPNTETTTSLEIPMADAYPESQYLLRKYVREYALENFDITLIDCPPSLGLFVSNAMIAADAVIIPVQAGSAYSVDNIHLVMNMIKRIQTEHNQGLKFLKLLITMANKKTVICKVLISEIRKHFPDEHIFKTEIPNNTALQQAEYAKETIFRWAANCPAAMAYRKVAKELIAITNGG